MNTATRDSEAKHELEFIGNHFFIPVFFLTIGFLIDVRTFATTLTEHFWLVFGIVGGLIGSKFLAAEIARRWYSYTSTEGFTMWSLSLPQVAATLAAAIVAYNTKNAAGERLIGEPMLNSVIVLLVVTSVLGPILTAIFAMQLPPPKEAAPTETPPVVSVRGSWYVVVGACAWCGRVAPPGLADLPGHIRHSGAAISPECPSAPPSARAGGAAPRRPRAFRVRSRRPE